MTFLVGQTIEEKEIEVIEKEIQRILLSRLVEYAKA